VIESRNETERERSAGNTCRDACARYCYGSILGISLMTRAAQSHSEPQAARAEP
jgi:hypothetical protein